MSAASKHSSLIAWLPDHLRVLRETVDAQATTVAGGAILLLLIQAYLLCAEMLARQLVLSQATSERVSS